MRIAPSLRFRLHRRFGFALVGVGVIGLAGPALAQDARQQCVVDAESGQQLLHAGKPRAALRALFACSQPACPGLVRRDCTTYLADAQAAVPSIILGARDAEGHDLADARVFLDGEPLVGALRGQTTDVEAGPHQLRFEHAGEPPVVQDFIAREREKGRAIVVQFSTSSPPAPAREAEGVARPVAPLTFLLGATTVVSAGVATAFVIRGASLRTSGCNPKHVCSASTYNDLETSFDVADVFAAVAVLSLGGTLWSYVARPQIRGPSLSFGTGPHFTTMRLGIVF